MDLVKERQNKKGIVPSFNDSLITVVKFTAVLCKSYEKLMDAELLPMDVL